MNDVIKSGNIIKKIRDGKQLEEIALFARNCIFRDGPKDTLVLEILSYLKLFQPTFFEKFEDELIETMGLFFKNPSPDTLQGVVFDMYRQHIKEKYGEDYTPMQASILEQIEDKHHFSFSAPTSTGKSFVFRNLIRSASNDVVRRVMRKAEPLSKISNLDVTDDSLDEKYKEFKEAINTGAFSDEYNLPSADVEKLHSDDVTAMIPQLLDMMFDDGDIISPNTDMKEVNDLFSKLYQQYLGRKLCQAEKSVLSTAVKIMIWKIYGKTFHRICQYRYAYASRTAERQQLYRKRNAEEANSIPAKYIVGYHDIPDKDLTAYPLVSTSIAAKDVDYDLIVYDTYDYLDKLIGFKLSDIFYAIFYQYYEATSDERALRLAKYFKYGTDKEREIWMLRYGFSFEEIEWVSECVDSIDETEIKFNDKINALDDAQLKSIEQYVHE